MLAHKKPLQHPRCWEKTWLCHHPGNINFQDKMPFSNFRVAKYSRKGRLVTTSGRVPGKQFHSSYVFLTYARPTIRDVSSFDVAISSMVLRLKREKSLCQADIQYYGCMESHEDGSPHFHVLLALSKQVCWSYESARERFSLPENFNDSVNMVVPEQGQSTFMFIRNHVN